MAALEKYLGVEGSFVNVVVRLIDGRHSTLFSRNDVRIVAIDTAVYITPLEVKE